MLHERQRRAVSILSVLGMALAALCSPRLVAQTTHFRTIYRFTPDDGSGGWGGNLLKDGKGGFFATTADGGSVACDNPYGCGTIYHLAPPAAPGAPWTKTTLYNFTGYPNDVEAPSLNVVTGPQTTLYGIGGGGANACNCGAVYSLRPPDVPGQPWIETILYSFAGGSDGRNPVSLVLGSNGVLYGITNAGGNSGCSDSVGCGIAFSLTPPATAGGQWIESVLYTFQGDYNIAGPSSIVLGPNGILYGTRGARYDPCLDQECGVVFSLTPPSIPGGTWTETVLHSFTGLPDGNSPDPGLALGHGGEIYGTTQFGGAHPCNATHAGCGSIFELTPTLNPDGTWPETLIYTFPGSPAANYPQTGVIIGPTGILYGSTFSGASAGCQDDSGCGEIYQLAPPSAPGGAWKETVLHRFSGGVDGGNPFMSLALTNGTLFGTTSATYAGSQWLSPGTVFRLNLE